MTIFSNICSLSILIINAIYNVAATVSQQNEIENVDSVVFNDDLTDTLPNLSNSFIDEQLEMDRNLNLKDDSGNNIHNEFELRENDINYHEKKESNKTYDLDSIELCVRKEIEPLKNNSTDDETDKPEETFCKTDINHQEHEKSKFLDNFDDIFCDFILDFNQDTSDKYMSKNMLEKSRANLEMQNINNIENVLCPTNNSNMINHIPFFEDKQSNPLLNDAFENHSNETLINKNIQSPVNSKDKNLYLLQNFHTENSKKLIKSQNIQQNDNMNILQNTWNCDELFHIQQHSESQIGQSEPRFLELVNFINSNQGEHDFQNNHFNFLLNNTINLCTNQQSEKINSVKIVEDGLSKPDTFQNKVVNCANSYYPNQCNDEYKNFNSLQKRKSKHKSKVQEEHTQSFSNDVLVGNEKNSVYSWKHNKTHNSQTNLPILHNSYFQPEGLKFKQNKNQQTSNNLEQENLIQHVLNNKKLKLNTYDDINYSNQRQHNTLDDVLNREDASLTYEEFEQNSEVVKDNYKKFKDLLVDTNDNQMYMVDDKFKAHNNQTFTRKEPTDENTNYNRKVNEISDHSNKKTFISKNEKIKTFDAQKNKSSIKNYDLNLDNNKIMHKKSSLNAENYSTKQKRTSVALSSRKKAQNKTISKKKLQYKVDLKKCTKNSKKKFKNNNDEILNQVTVKRRKTRISHKKKNKFRKLFLLDDVFIDNLNNVTTISSRLERSNLYCHNTNVWLERKCNQNNQKQNDISIILQRFTQETNFFEKNIISVLSTINKLIHIIYSIYLDFNKLSTNIVHTEELQQNSVNFEDKIRSLYFELQNSSDLNMRIVDLTFFRMDNFNFTNINACKILSISKILENIKIFNDKFKEKNESFYNFIASNETEFCNTKIEPKNLSGILKKNKIQKILKYSESIKKLVKKIINLHGNYKNRTFNVMQDYFRIRLRFLCTNFVRLSKDIEKNTKKDILYKNIESIIKSLIYVIFCIDSLYLFTSLNAKPDIFGKFSYIFNTLNLNKDEIFFKSKHDLISSSQLKKLSYKYILHYHIEVYKFLEIFYYLSWRYSSLMHLNKTN